MSLHCNCPAPNLGHGEMAVLPVKTHALAVKGGFESAAEHKVFGSAGQEFTLH